MRVNRQRTMAGAAAALVAGALFAGGIAPAAQAAEPAAPTITVVPVSWPRVGHDGTLGTATQNLPYSARSGAVGDPTNPVIEVRVAQTGADGGAVDAAALEVTAEVQQKTHAQYGAYVSPFGDTPAADAVTVSAVEGSSELRRLDVTPTRIGTANLVVTVTGEGGKTASTTIDYYASKSTTSTSRQLQKTSDGSTAIDVGDGYFFVADDESPWIRLYDGDQSGLPVGESFAGWNPNAPGNASAESDFESSARSGDSVYWLGSHGNSRKGEVQTSRHTVYETKLTGTGKDARLTPVGSYGGLRQDLLDWDRQNGNRYGFVAAAAAGMHPTGADRFNIEGAEFAPDGETLYLGFRSPLVGQVQGGDALIVPVTNFTALTDPNRPAGTRAVFGEPIELKMNGGSIREIRKNASGEYLILGKEGSTDETQEEADSRVHEPSQLWFWDGNPGTRPQRLGNTEEPDAPAHVQECDPRGTWEAIAEVPDRLEPGSRVRLIMDQGHDAGLYKAQIPGRGCQTNVQDQVYALGQAKDITWDAVRKSRTDLMTLHGELGYKLAATGLEVFAGRQPGTVSEPRSVTLTNTGRKTVPVGGLSVGGDFADDFELDPGSCVSAVLEPGDDCRATVRFEPQRGAVTSTAQLRVDSSAPLLFDSFGLTGVAERGVFTAAPDPVIAAASPRVGDRLTVGTGQWAPAAEFGYQWLRGGYPIPGATGASYTATADDQGFRLSVRVVGTTAGYETKTLTSEPTAAIGARLQKKVTKNISSTPTVKASAVKGKKLKLTVTANQGVSRGKLAQRVTVTVAGVKGSYKAKLKNGTATVKLGKKAKKLKKGKRVRVTVTAPKLSYATVKRTTAQVTTTTYTVAKASKTVRVKLR